MAVARFRPNGSLDASFDPDGTDGPGKKLFGAESSLATAVQVQLDGRIVLARGGSNGNDNDFGVTRLNPDGSVDSTTFDLADFGGSESPAAAALQPDGKIVLAGTTYPPQQGSPPRVAVARYDVDGSLDQTFGGTGKTTLEFGSSNNVAATAVHVQPGGKLVVAGYGTDDIDFVVARLNSDGTPDGAFGTGGTSTIDFGLIEMAMAAVLQPDGKIVLAGGAQPSTTDWDFGAARLLPGGALDATFGNGGKTTVPSGPIEFANAAALQPDGKIVLAGYTQGAQQNVALVRLEGVTPSAAGGGGAGAGPGGPRADRTAPILSRFSASPRRFRAGRRTSAAVKRARRSTKLTLVLSERASVRFDAFAVSTGRRVGTRCRKATRSNRKRNRCTLRVRKGGFSRSFDAGASNLAFRGRVGKRTLAPGRYSLRATPTDAAGNTGKPRAVALRLVD